MAHDCSDAWGRSRSSRRQRALCSVFASMMRSQDRVCRCYAPVVFCAPTMRLSTRPVALGGMRVPTAHHRVHPVRRSTQPKRIPENPGSTIACILDFPASRRIPSGSRVLSSVLTSVQAHCLARFLSDTHVQCLRLRTRTLQA